MELVKINVKNYVCRKPSPFLFLWSQHIEEVLILSQKRIRGLARDILCKLIFQMGIAASLCFYFYRSLITYTKRYDYEKNNRMSKQDIKDEHKNIEGDPLIKSKIKQKQREMAMSRMMQEVPKADVIITNPTHYAIALKYDEEKRMLPMLSPRAWILLLKKLKELPKAIKSSW